MNNEDGNLVEVKRARFTNEKEIQQTVEKNLKSMFNLTLIDSEFSFGRNRIDTLAFDDERKIFVIIEYKIKEDKKTINQVFNYFGGMMAHKADFLLVYHKKIGKLRKREVNWAGTRILLIAPRFHVSMLNALRVPDVMFELWKVRRYQNGTVDFKQLRNVNNHIKELDLPRPHKPKSDKKKKRKKSTSLRAHLKKCDKNTKKIYKEIDRQIMEMISNAQILRKKSYISFTLNSRNFIRICTRRNRLLVYLPLKLEKMHISQPPVLTIIKKEHRYGGDSEITVSKQSEIIHLMKLVKQSYEKVAQKQAKKQPVGKTQQNIMKSNI